MEPAPLAGESRIVSLGQDAFAFSQRRSIRPRAPVTRARTKPMPAGSISGTADLRDENRRRWLASHSRRACFGRRTTK